VLEALKTALGTVAEWTDAATESAVAAVAERLGLKLGKVAQPLRVALTGRAASPGIGTTLVLVGRERALARIERALGYVDATAAGT
jgi:glutamyl-tRNA synthetase